MENGYGRLSCLDTSVCLHTGLFETFPKPNAYIKYINIAFNISPSMIWGLRISLQEFLD